jgi:hypothetical protein
MVNRRRALHRGIDIASVAAALFICVALVRAHILAARFSSAASLVGMRAHSLLALDYAESAFTLIVALASSCGYCTQSIRAVADIARAAGQRGGRIVAVGTEAVPDLTRYVASHGVQVDDVRHLSRDRLLAQFTPRLLLVDRRGIVRHDWLGAPTDAGRAEILESLNRFR